MPALLQEITFRKEKLLDTRLAESIAALAADNRSGAVEIAEQAADILMRRARVGEASSPQGFRQAILETGRALIQSQPAVAPLIHLVNAVMWKLEQCETPAALRSGVEEAVEQFKRQLRRHSLRVSEGVLPLITEGNVIVTLSYSTTVIQSLLHAYRAGRRFSVICAESRPGYEGRTTAARLASYDIPVTLLVDTAAVAMVPQANMVLIGADLLTLGGLVNKVGTRALALAAQASGVPLYTLCSSEKLLPQAYPTPQQRDWPTREIWPEAPNGVMMRNVYFDMTPLDAIAGIVTEKGVLTPAGIEAWLAAAKLHPSLASSTLVSSDY